MGLGKIVGSVFGVFLIIILIILVLPEISSLSVLDPTLAARLLTLRDSIVDAFPVIGIMIVAGLIAFMFDQRGK